MCLANLHTAIAQFDDWQHPWKFEAAVRLSLSADEQLQFAAIWDAALDAEHWKSASLEECAANATAAVSRLFPHMQGRDIEAIVSAAAFQWK